MSDIRRHKRVLNTLTGPLEKPALIWMAEHSPEWVTPDRLTWLGVLGSATVFAGLALSALSRWFLWLAVAGLVVNWLGDSLDGTLARVRHIERPRFGFYVDHTIDVISEGLVILGLGVSPYVNLTVAALTFCGYLAMSVLAYVRTCVDGTFRISYSRIGPTELRLLLVALMAAMFFLGSPKLDTPFGPVGLWDFTVGTVAVALAIAFVLSLIKGVRQLKDVDSADRP